MQQIVQNSEIIKKITHDFDQTLTLTHHHHHHNHNADDNHNDYNDDDDYGGDFEFFVGADRNSPISADDIFQNGQIRPMFPFSGENPRRSDGATTSYLPPVRKVFVAASPAKKDGEATYCEWSPEMKTPAPEMRRKSKSTGFSKLWRVRDLLVRSRSDGKEAFVYLGRREEEERVNVAAEIRVSKGKSVTVSKEEGDVKGEMSVYSVLYGNKKDKGGKGGRKSYLPYRQDLVGFFTSAGTGMTRNVHPY